MSEPRAPQEEVASLDLGAEAVSLVSAAVIAAGPGATDAAVELQMERIVTLANGRAMQRVSRWSGAVHFPCVILGAELEDNTRRWLIDMATKPHPKWNPKGREEIRTDRLDSGSPVADQIGRWAREHIGSPAWATKVMEKEADGTPHRVLVALKPSASVAEGITVPSGTPVRSGESAAATGPARSRASEEYHSEPEFDPRPVPSAPAPNPKPVPGPGRMREEDRLAQKAMDRAEAASEPLPPEPPGEHWKRPPADTAPAAAQAPTAPTSRPLGSDRPPTRAQLSDIAIHAGKAGYTDDVAAHVHVDTICRELFGYSIFGDDGQPHYTNIRSARDAAQIDARLKEEAKRAAS